MKLIENECSEALTRLLRPYYAKVNVQNVYHSINKGHSIEDDSNLLTLLIQEYFDNPPLKWEEIKVNDVIFDKELKETINIKDKFIFDDIKNITFEIFGSNRTYAGTYEENRFYRKEVQE